MAAKKRPTKKSRKKACKKGSIKKSSILLLALLLFFVAYVIYLNQHIKRNISDGFWSEPSRVYARPLQIKPGLKLGKKEFIQELDLLAYRQDTSDHAGSYQAFEQTVIIHRRAFQYPDAEQSQGRFRIEFEQGYVVDIFNDNGFVLPSLTLEPVLLSSFYGDKGEDRLILDYADIPQSLIRTLIAVEDREFYQHIGINPAAIFRALMVNFKAGKTLQGGSTITQQLVKNMFLTSERSLLRKFNEAIYALLIEWHLDKQSIMTAYINQVFLTQKKQIAIHGFALASQFLFKKPLHQLGLEQQALLVAMIKGPSYYHPVKNPERALKRRNLVIGIMHEQGLVTSQTAQQLRLKPLGLQVQNTESKRFPAFIDLVKKQLPAQYDQHLLKTSGLKIFTTLDPLIQIKTEQAVLNNKVLGKQQKLQAASVVVQYQTGNILALTSDRQPDYPGYNRAILAQRPIGSLMKPLLLYTLLEAGESLATRVQDRPITLKQSDGKLWTPNNYDAKLHGEVSLYQALVYSYNLPFVRIGLDKSLKPLVHLLEQFRLQKNAVIYPSLLLGSIDLTPLEVAQIYQTLANDGIYSPLTSIRFVTDKKNQLLVKNPLATTQLLNVASTAQVQSAMKGVIEKGTGRYLKQVFPQYTLAGKTGTTDDYKDSWFVGYSERLLGVVWMGYDKNKGTHLSGASGALRLWADIFKQLPIKTLQKAKTDQIEWVSTDATGLFLMDSYCEGSQLLPFKKGEAPQQEKSCDDSVLKRATQWLRNLFH